MKFSSKLVAVFLVVSLFCLSGCNEKTPATYLWETESFKAETNTLPDTAVKTILLTHTETQDSLTHEIALEFKKRLEEKSQNKFTVEIFGNNTLGSLNDAVLTMGNGAVEMRLGAGPSDTLGIIRWMPSVNGANLDTINSALQVGSPVRQMVDLECAESGVRILGITQAIYRNLTSNDFVDSIDDFANLNVRVINSGLDKDYWETLGTATQSFLVEQVYMALQQGLVNSQENTIPSIVWNKLYEQQKYLTIVNHKVYFDTLYIDEAYYQGLSPQERLWVEKSAIEAISYGNSIQTKYLTQGFSILAKGGMMINTLSMEKRNEINDLVSPVVREELAVRYGSQLLATVMEYVK